MHESEISEYDQSLRCPSSDREHLPVACFGLSVVAFRQAHRRAGFCCKIILEQVSIYCLMVFRLTETSGRIGCRLSGGVCWTR